MNKKISFLLALAMCFTLGLSATACGESAELSDAGIVSDEISASENSTLPEEEVKDEETGKTLATIQTASIADLRAFNEAGVTIYDITNGFHPTADPDSVADLKTDAIATLETAYIFTASETVLEAKQNKYADWHADYYVSVDKDIAVGTLGLAGSYNTWDNGNWVAFYNPVAVKANERVGLLASMDGNPWTYVEVVEIVSEFRCGAFDKEDACKGVTLTVELCLTNPADGEVVVVSTTSYTFA